MKLYKFLRLFWTPKCMHKWVAKDRFSVRYAGEGYSRYEYGDQQAGRIVSECSKCGKWESFKV